MRRAICTTVIACAALALSATASADDRSVAEAYISQTSTLAKENKAIAKYTRQWVHHRTGATKAIRVLKRQRKTLYVLAATVNGQTESTPKGGEAKQLALQAIKTNAQSDRSAIKAFVAARHHHLSKAAHHFKVATKLLKKAARLDKEATQAFHDAGVY